MDKLSKIYLDEIVEWNKKFNLTGLKTFDDIKSKLYDDSLNIAKAADLNQNTKVIDIGCGAGFPGIPLKIEYPNIELTLVDSVGKKIKFVQHVIDKLQLKDCVAVQARAEVLGRDSKFREKFDIAVSRAVADLSVLSEYCLPFVKVGGLFIAPKGPDIDEELASSTGAIAMLGGRIKDTLKVDSGHLIVIEKVKPSPRDYPRPAGIPSKRPI